MSFERLVDHVLKRPWRRIKGSNSKPQSYDNQHAYPQSRSRQNEYVYPDQESDLPEFIKNEIANQPNPQSHYDSTFGPNGSNYGNYAPSGKPKIKKKRQWLKWILSWILPERERYKKNDVPRQYRPWYWAVTVFMAYWGMIGAIWATLMLVVAVTVYALISPDPLKAGLTNKPAYLSILASNGKVIAEKGLRRNHVTLEEMPKHVVNAVLATEDWRFYYHPGVDPIGILRATYKNRRAGRIVEGGSTITQQLAKVLFLKPTKSYWRKVEEMLLSFWLEYRFSKKQILELYLNRIYFGAGNYGIEAAAQHYFGKSIANVTVYEGAMLAGLIKSPSYYAPTRDLDRALERGRVVLQNMYNGWFLSRKEHQEVLKQAPVLRSYLPSESYGYVIDWVVERVSDYGQNLQDDMIVETTIDYDLQGTAQRVVKETMEAQGTKYNASQAAAVILDRDGAVKALVGGTDYTKNQFNRIVKARRQPGSTFKAFVYLAAMQKGMKPDSMVHDGPVRVGDWTPKNYSNRYYGDVTMREALARSLNTVSVRLAEWAGREQVIQTAHRLGISTRLNNNPSIALGTSEVSPLELTAAYVPFANGGFAVQPHIIRKISDKKGTVLYENTTKNWGRVMRPHFVSAMNDMMTTTVIQGTAKAAALDPHQVAGKTGTGQGYRDAWFIGYTGHYIGGVWMGNDDFTPMNEATGGSVPTIIWHDIMQYAHLNKEPVALPGGNWKSQSTEWAESGGGQRRSFWDSLFGGGSSGPSSDTTLGSDNYERSRQKQKNIFEDIFGGN